VPRVLIRVWRVAKSEALTVHEDNAAKRSLRRYFRVLRNETVSRFLIAKKIAAEWSEDDSLSKLWLEHARCSNDFQSLERKIDVGTPIEETPSPGKSYLDLKIRIATEILKDCHFCTRGCRVNRLKVGLGYCGCGNAMMVSSIFAHMGEEPELVPSGTIFTMGCTIRCCHCQNWAISQWKATGTEFKAEEMATEIEQLRLNGCRNVNLVGGEPTPWLKQWLEAFKCVEVSVPVVWNSNSYYSQETAGLLAGFVDVYLLDFKYGPGECAARISDAPNYWAACTRNHLEARKHGELIIRVLVLPSHLNCCTTPILNWVRENLGSETRVNLMFQYRPEWNSHKIPELHRRLTKEEMENAVSLAHNIGLSNVIT